MSDTPATVTRFEIVHQQQPDGQTCGQTCLAMILGVPVADVVKVFGRIGCSTRELYYALDRCALWWNALLYEYPMLHGHYIAMVPSLNIEAGTHYVVIRRDENGETVFDPNRGREGKKFYGNADEGGVPIRFKLHLLYVCKSGWCGDWYDGHLPAAA